MTKRLHFHFSLSCFGEGNGNPLQCSCLENPRDSGAWWAAVYGVAQSRTWLKPLSSSSSSSINRSLVLWWWCVVGEEGFYSPMIGSQSFSEPMLLDFELNNCLLFFYPLGGRGWLEWARVGYFPSPGKAVSDNILAIQVLVSPEDRPCWEETSALAF